MKNIGRFIYIKYIIYKMSIENKIKYIGRISLAAGLIFGYSACRPVKESNQKYKKVSNELKEEDFKKFLRNKTL